MYEIIFNQFSIKDYSRCTLYKEENSNLTSVSSTEGRGLVCL